MRGISLLVALLLACGGNSSGTDAASDVAVVTVDAPPLAPVYRRWVINHQYIPYSNFHAMAWGLDLDGDGIVDNQLGRLFAALFSQGFDIPASTEVALWRGLILMLAEADVANATFTMYAGADAQPMPCFGPGDSTCQRHLMGTGSFDIEDGTPHNVPLYGSLANDTLIAGPGQLRVQVLFMDGPSNTLAPVSLDLKGARVRIEKVSPTGFAESIIAGAVPRIQIETRVYPTLLQNMTVAVAASCTNTTPPACGCTPGSRGSKFLNLFDTAPKDCQVSLDEIKNNTMLQPLLTPDLIVDGQPALSLGFAATSVKAMFVSQ